MTRSVLWLSFAVLATSGVLAAQNPPAANPAAKNPHLGNPQF